MVVSVGNVLAPITISVLIVTVGIIYSRSIRRSPATAKDGQSRVLAFPLRAYGMGLNASLLAFFVCASLLLLFGPSEAGVTTRLILASILGAVAYLCWKGFCYFRTRIEFDESGFTRIDGSRRICIGWAELASVDAFTFAGELRLKSAGGDFAIIRKGYVGSLDFIEMMRRRVPEGVWQSALRYYEPRSGGGGRPSAWGDPFNEDRSSTG